jgi:hypothetical protein
VSQKAQPVVADTDPIKGALAVICAALMGIVDKIRAAKIIQNALGIESDDVANYCLPKSWPAERAARPRHRRVAADRGALSALTDDLNRRWPRAASRRPAFALMGFGSASLDCPPSPFGYGVTSRGYWCGLRPDGQDRASP